MEKDPRGQELCSIADSQAVRGGEIGPSGVGWGRRNGISNE
jgi:hypothetical protein